MVALALSAFLGWHYLMGGEMIGCGVGNACDQVLNSRWSAIGGVLPVSGLAAGAYLAMLTASLFIGPATEAPVRRLAWRAMLVLAGAAAGSAVWFIIVQKWIVGAFCPYCMATHVTGLLLGTLTVWQAPQTTRPCCVPYERQRGRGIPSPCMGWFCWVCLWQASWRCARYTSSRRLFIAVASSKTANPS